MKKLTTTIPPKRGPNPQGLNIPLKQVKVADTPEKINGKTSIEVDPQEEIEIEQEKALEAEDPGVEVTPNEDGSVEVNFDPSKVNIEGTPNHFDNLAELLPEDITDPIGSELVENYMDYKSSRKEWEQAYTTGLDLLGFKYENRTEPK
jgi:hypothetical protein